VLLTIFGLVERVAHRPSPFHATLSPAEIGAEDLLLKQAGLATTRASPQDTLMPATS
jgi:hypothetical protein